MRRFQNKTEEERKEIKAKAKAACEAMYPGILKRQIPESCRGHIIDRDLFTQMTGLELHDKVWELEPIGARIHVAIEPNPEEFGGIVIPDQSRQQLGTHGWIMAVGPDAGMEASYPGNLVVSSPRDLLGLYIYAGYAVGQPMRLGIRDDDFYAPMRILTSRDTYFIDTRPWVNPWDIEDE